MKHIAIFASGAGSNAKKIIEYFDGHTDARVCLVVSNNKNAGVLQIASDNRIAVEIISKNDLQSPEKMTTILTKYQIDWIVLAGFLLQIPSFMVHIFPNKIINIHPALLPKYGGKGMYGHKVHQAVIDAKETESGITIHFVDELYDHGKTISQITCNVLPTDTPNSLAERIHQLEHQFFSRIIEQVIM